MVVSYYRGTPGGVEGDGQFEMPINPPSKQEDMQLNMTLELSREGRAAERFVRQK